jgi:hypothetical protein
MEDFFTHESIREGFSSHAYHHPKSQVPRWRGFVDIEMLIVLGIDAGRNVDHCLDRKPLGGTDKQILYLYNADLVMMAPLPRDVVCAKRGSVKEVGRFNDCRKSLE